MIVLPLGAHRGGWDLLILPGIPSEMCTYGSFFLGSKSSDLIAAVGALQR